MFAGSCCWLLFCVDIRGLRTLEIKSVRVIIYMALLDGSDKAISRSQVVHNLQARPIQFIAQSIRRFTLWPGDFKLFLSLWVPTLLITTVLYVHLYIRTHMNMYICMEMNTLAREPHRISALDSRPIIASPLRFSLNPDSRHWPHTPGYIATHNPCTGWPNDTKLCAPSVVVVRTFFTTSWPLSSKLASITAPLCARPTAGLGDAALAAIETPALSYGRFFSTQIIHNGRHTIFSGK